MSGHNIMRGKIIRERADTHTFGLEGSSARFTSLPTADINLACPTADNVCDPSMRRTSTSKKRQKIGLKNRLLFLKKSENN
jgi:hypothetical protein